MGRKKLYSELRRSPNPAEWKENISLPKPQNFTVIQLHVERLVTI